MATLTKAELSEGLATNVNINRRDAKDFIENLFELVRITLESGKDVKISGFGNFELRDKGERPGRNPKTGEDIPISARRVVTFKPSNKLKDRIEAAPQPESSETVNTVEEKEEEIA